MDEFREGQWIPHCELMLEWKKKDEIPERLQYKVKLNGARAPKDFFQLVLDPAEGINVGLVPRSSPPSVFYHLQYAKTFLVHIATNQNCMELGKTSE